MHETTLIRDMLDVVARVRQENGGRPVRKVTVVLSEFGGWEDEHFRRHFEEGLRLRSGQEPAASWQDVELEIERVPTGPEARLVRVTLRS